MTLTNLKSALFLAGLTALYFLLAKFGMQLALGGTTVSMVWPAAGLGIAYIYLYGWRGCLPIVLGAALSQIGSHNTWVISHVS